MMGYVIVWSLGAAFGYLVANIKIWQCILASWRTRDITWKLGGEENLALDYKLGWLDGHREVVRQIDLSPWTWWMNKKKVVEEVLEDK